jgi:ferredoxin
MKKSLHLDPSRCLACAGCVGVCPEMSLDLSGDLVLTINHETCTLCLRCVMACPVSALSPSPSPYET